MSSVFLSFEKSSHREDFPCLFFFTLYIKLLTINTDFWPKTGFLRVIIRSTNKGFFFFLPISHSHVHLEESPRIKFGMVCHWMNRVCHTQCWPSHVFPGAARLAAAEAISTGSFEAGAR